MSTCLVQIFLPHCPLPVGLIDKNWPWTLIHIVVYNLTHGCCVLFWYWRLLPSWVGHKNYFLYPLLTSCFGVLEMIQHMLLGSLKPLWAIPVFCCQSGMVLIHLSYYPLYALYWPVYLVSMTPSETQMCLFHFYDCSCILITFPVSLNFYLLFLFHNFCDPLLSSIYLCPWISFSFPSC